MGRPERVDSYGEVDRGAERVERGRRRRSEGDEPGGCGRNGGAGVFERGGELRRLMAGLGEPDLHGLDPLERERRNRLLRHQLGQRGIGGRPADRAAQLVDRERPLGDQRGHRSGAGIGRCAQLRGDARLCRPLSHGTSVPGR